MAYRDLSPMIRGKIQSPESVPPENSTAVLAAVIEAGIAVLHFSDISDGEEITQIMRKAARTARTMEGAGRPAEVLAAHPRCTSQVEAFPVLEGEVRLEDCTKEFEKLFKRALQSEQNVVGVLSHLSQHYLLYTNNDKYLPRWSYFDPTPLDFGDQGPTGAHILSSYTSLSLYFTLAKILPDRGPFTLYALTLRDGAQYETPDPTPVPAAALAADASDHPGEMAAQPAPASRLPQAPARLGALPPRQLSRPQAPLEYPPAPEPEPMLPAVAAAAVAGAPDQEAEPRIPPEEPGQLDAAQGGAAPDADSVPSPQQMFVDCERLEAMDQALRSILGDLQPIITTYRGLAAHLEAQQSRLEAAQQENRSLAAQLAHERRRSAELEERLRSRPQQPPPVASQTPSPPTRPPSQPLGRAGERPARPEETPLVLPAPLPAGLPETRRSQREVAAEPAPERDRLGSRRLVY
ncbi:hypothetical protein PAPYR_104 [Paratrimastix pyriformis]|uniref:Uncharacterized protein n=1 Tax=Paratrimastix pyriformis TaxID=342808 RepID=A0ABQ8UUW2_9EUKA|nr:hypothetical protein PAPYR_104 [Paratrimastix pyriformis]